MADSDFQSVPLTERAPKMISPRRSGGTVAAAIVGKDENATGVGVTVRAVLFPPGADGIHRECGSVMAEAEIDRSLVGDRIIDTIGYYLAFGVGRKVMVGHVTGPVTPQTSGVFEVADEFLLLCVDADDRFLISGEALTHTTDAAELQVAFGALLQG